MCKNLMQKTCLLGNIAKVVSGFAFKSSEFCESGTPVIKIGNIKLGNVDLSSSQFVSDNYLSSINPKFKVHRNDILISLTGSHVNQPNSVVGRVARYPRTYPLALLNQRAGKVIVTKPEKCDSLFLFYQLFDDNVRRDIASFAHGAANQANVSPSQIENLNIFLPELPIQRKIASILSAYDDLIENNLRRIKILEEMAQNLYREWFVKFRFPGHEKVRFIDSELGKIPEGWEVRKLEDLIDLHIGGGWGKEDIEKRFNIQGWVIRGTDIPKIRYGQVPAVPKRYHTAANLKSRTLDEGDIIFEVSGGSKNQNLGRALYITHELLKSFPGDHVICASFCKKIRPKADVYASEIMYLSFLEAYESGEIAQYQVQSTGISNYKWSDYIQNVFRAIPVNNIQDSFSKQVGPLLRETALLGRKNTILRQTRDLLLPCLISGEVDVSELDINVPQ